MEGGIENESLVSPPNFNQVPFYFLYFRLMYLNPLPQDPVCKYKLLNFTYVWMS